MSIHKLEVVAEADASGPLDGAKTVYTVALDDGEYLADVMHRPDTGLLYVMQHEDGKEVSNRSDLVINEAEIIAFMRNWLAKNT